jgi:GTPase SAR1 family protein
LNNYNIEILRQHISLDEPFGPTEAGEIKDYKVLEILFERHNKLYKALLKRPAIVIGRKGSGKTSYLNSVYFDSGFTYVVNLNTSDAFASVIKSISSITSGLIFAESVQQVWKNAIYTGLFSEIRDKLPKQFKSRALINDYLAKIGLRDKGTIDDILWKISEIISERAKDKPYTIATEIIKVFDNVSFKNVLETLEYELGDTNSRAVILLDSLDDFHLQIEVVARAMEGLLKFIGESNRPSAKIDVRFCLPAELYHRFMSLSTNPNKDFKRKLVLHWTAPELIAVAAHRLILFAEAYPDHPLAISDRLENVENGHSVEILKNILPAKVTCRLGIEEDPIAYILRHTQLLPRHLIIILNSICNLSKRYPGSNPQKLSEEAIRLGIAAIEETLVQEIFVAYKTVYPRAEEVCKNCIPELQHKFSIGDLERVFRSHGKKAMYNDEFLDFKRMLIEMGIIGRILPDNFNDSQRYFRAEFEYTVPHKLVSSTDDMLCFHPLFTEVFSAKTDDKKPVYPYGTRFEDKDYRNEY